MVNIFVVFHDLVPVHSINLMGFKEYESSELVINFPNYAYRHIRFIKALKTMWRKAPRLISHSKFHLFDFTALKFFL